MGHSGGGGGNGDIVELGAVTRPIPHWRQIPTACHRTE